MRRLRGLDCLVQFAFRLVQQLLGLRPVSGHVIVIRCARPVHFVNGLHDVIVDLVQIVPIVDLIGQSDSPCPKRQTGEGNQ